MGLIIGKAFLDAVPFVVPAVFEFGEFGEGQGEFFAGLVLVTGGGVVLFGEVLELAFEGLDAAAGLNEWRGSGLPG